MPSRKRGQSEQVLPWVSLFLSCLPHPLHPAPSQDKEDDDSSSSASDSDVLAQDSYERAEKRPILSVRKSWGSRLACAFLWSMGFPFLMERAQGGSGVLPAETLRERFPPEG